MFRSARHSTTTTRMRTRRYRRVAVVLTGLATAAAVTPAGVPAASAAPLTYRITTAGSSLALDVQDSATTDDTPVVQNPVNVGSRSQAWQTLLQSNGNYELVNANSGMCLSVYYAQTTAGAPLVQYDCHGYTDQQWKINGPNSTGDFSFQSALDNFYVDVPGGSVAWNTQLDLWPGSGPGGTPAVNQLFLMLPVST
ncbi:MAG: Endo,4-beta-xylanase precursor [Modestobacter sp.]|jgi:hypothetical protein|nr:Endo,4-beta-xylanase precursor [Modestobacter sp.]